MNKIAIIGDRESIKGFAAIGIHTVSCDVDDTAAQKLNELCSGEYGIVFITEELARHLKEEISKYDNKFIPAIIPLTGVKNNNGIGMDRLKASVEKAVGSDIIFNK